MNQHETTIGGGLEVTGRKARREGITPTLEKNFAPKKSTKKCILRNFICHLDRHFLKFLAISVGNQQRTETTNPLQIDTF